MSIGPLGASAGAAGSPLAQAKGAELEQARLGAHRRQEYYDEKAEAAAGIGQPDGEDHETDQRDADGRRPPEDQPQPGPRDVAQTARLSKDPSRQSGNLLDLTG